MVVIAVVVRGVDNVENSKNTDAVSLFPAFFINSEKGKTFCLKC